MIKLYGIIFFSIIVHAERTPDEIKKTIIDQDNFTTTQEKQIYEINKEISEIEKKEREFSEYVSNKDEYVKRLKEYIPKNIEVQSVFSLINKPETLPSCLNTALDNKSQQEINKCFSDTETKLNSNTIENLKQKIKIPKFDEEESLKNLDRIKELEAKRKNAESNIIFSKRRSKNFEYEYQAAKKIAEEKIEIPDSLLDCNENTQEINLENPKIYPGSNVSGVFNGLKQDHQDGVGSCYANSAKYLIYGVTDGESNSSFLDLALQYKISSSELENESKLDGGVACDIVNLVNEIGFCEQKDSVFETGKKNGVINQVYSRELGQSYQTVLDKFKKFIDSRKKLENSAIMPEKIKFSAYNLINLYKTNPNIPDKFPGTNSDGIIETHSVMYSYYKASGLSGDEAKGVREEYEILKKKYQNREMILIKEGKSPNDIFSDFLTYLKPFLDKHKIEVDDKDRRNYYVNKVTPEFKDKKFKANVDSYLSLLKFALDKSDVSDDEFLEKCSQEESNVSDFLNSSIQIIKSKNANFDPMMLIDENGQFASTEEIFQLLIAPKCLNPENRKKTNPISCYTNDTFIPDLKANSSLSEEEKIKNFRKRVLQSLVQGLPVGNSHTADFGNHINTIIGMKFNKQTKSCDYIIRESNMGETIAVPEKKIFSKIYSLSEVRKN